ncbi:MAG: hypothetical protein HYV09_28235 [Deltaproteobacteria bacterium]|nr:hypothetical protein [Deltaproteobacteria bacterium]
MTRWWPVFALLLAGCGGASGAVPRAPHLRPEQLHDAATLSVADLGALARRPKGIIKQELTIAIHDVQSGKGFEGRGAVMVKPREALRMILLGPGGTTAMDVWIAGARFRVAIPAIDRVVRGDASTPREKMRGMPVDLLWRWLVDPFGGTPVAARRGLVADDGRVIDGDGLVAFLKRGPTSFEVRARHGATARGWFFERGRLVGVATGREIAIGDGLFPADVDYVGLDPRMTVEVRATGATVVPEVSPAVFADPDAR